MKYSAEQIEGLLAGGSLERLGIGMRRVCYRLPCGRLCLKCYRSDEEIGEGKYPGVSPNVPLSASVVREIRVRRFDRRRNTCALEYRYWRRTLSGLPPEVSRVFPSSMELVESPSRGWCQVEELVANADGSPAEPFADAWVKADSAGRAGLSHAYMALADGLARHAVRFFDPNNVLVQRDGRGGFRLRITDFEPSMRTFLPVEAFSAAFVRRKVRRRMSRYMENFEGFGAGRPPISMSFSVSDSYSQHLAVVLASVLANNPSSDFVFHVLHRDISDENQARTKRLEGMFANCKIRFHEIDGRMFDAFPIPEELEHVTQEMYYRYVLPDVLQDEDRTIYSDVDVLCVGDLRPLWETDLGGCLAAAVAERPSAGEFKKRLIGLDDALPYFYSGLMVMDLAGLRAGGYPRKLMENTVRYAGKIAWPDQDVINITLRGRIVELGPEWDGINVRYSPFRRGVSLWHFPGATLKPWCNIWKNVTWLPYLKYLLKTPYRGNAAGFLWGHVKGFFFFKYTKKQVTRYLVCGIRVWRSRRAPRGGAS